MTYRFRVDDQCRGLNLSDGAEYKSRDGIVEIEREDHAAWVRGNPAVYHGHMGKDGVTYLPARTEADGDARRPCPRVRCHFVGWSWQETCPRCGGPLTIPEPAVPA